MNFSTHRTRRLVEVLAIASLVAGLGASAAAAGDAQYSDVFSRAVARQAAAPDAFERYVASHQLEAGIVAPGGEAKNQYPFVRPVIARSQAQVVSLPARRGAAIIGERKNQLPFTRPASTSPVAAQSAATIGATRSGFPWEDAAIGAGAAIAIMLTVLAVVRSSRAREAAPTL